MLVEWAVLQAMGGAAAGRWLEVQAATVAAVAAFVGLGLVCWASRGWRYGG